MKVHEIVNAHHRNARRANRAVEVGEKLYVIQDDKTGYYFIWCYLDEKFANELAGKLRIEDETDRAFNWRVSYNDCVHSARTSMRK